MRDLTSDMILVLLKHCIDIVKSCAAHFVVYSVKCELDQLCDGLSTMGFMELCWKKPGLMRSLFLPQHPPPLTADCMINVFSTRFSPQGSNLRETEEAVAMKWIHFLQMIEGRCNFIYTAHMYIQLYVCTDLWILIFCFTDNNGIIKSLSHNGEEMEIQMQFQSILFFVTGAPREPPLKY